MLMYFVSILKVGLLWIGVGMTGGQARTAFLDYKLDLFS